MSAYTISALGRGYLVGSSPELPLAWSDVRADALEFATRNEAYQELGRLQKLPGFPEHAQVTPGVFGEAP